MAKIVKMIGESVSVSESTSFKSSLVLTKQPSSLGSLALQIEADPAEVESALAQLADLGLVSTITSGSTGPYAADLYFLTGDGRHWVAENKRAGQVSESTLIYIRASDSSGGS